MTIIDRYIGTRILATLLKIVLALMLLYVVVDLITTRQRVIDKYDVPWFAVFQYYVSHVPIYLLKFQALGLALLIATLFVLGRAAQDSEITALLAGGVSMVRIARTPVLIGLMLTIGVFIFENTGGVWSAQLANRLDEEYFSRAKPSESQGHSWTRLGPDKWTCHILRFNREALTGTDVFIHAFGPAGMQEIRARRIYWEPDTAQWMLEDGRWAIIRRIPGENVAGGDSQIAAPLQSVKDERRITQIAAPFSETPAMLFALDDPPENKSVSVLYQDIQRADAMGQPTGRARVAFHTKFSRPALCFIIVWLAIPFALRMRRGGIFLSFGVSIALGLAYVTLYAIATGLGNINLVPPVVAAWFANSLFMAGGLIFFGRMRT